MSDLGDTLDRLWATIESRRGGDPSASWTAKLLADPKLAAKKLGEEGLEAALACALGDKANLTAEAADVPHDPGPVGAADVPLDAVHDLVPGFDVDSGGLVGVTHAAPRAGARTLTRAAPYARD